MERQLKQVIEWHTKFDIPFATVPLFNTTTPIELIKLRGRIMQEEVNEWVESALNNYPVDKRAKELADILYTVFGTIITEGFQDIIVRVFDDVHKSNMSKLDSNGFPVKRNDGKVLKSENYKEPNLNWIYTEPYF